MTSFLELLSHYPGIVPSVLMGALIVFWLLAIVGVLDFDQFGPHFDADVDLLARVAGREIDAAVRAAIPEANPSIYLTMSLAITFPFNILVSLSLWQILARWLWTG